ncbi:hypothetical protein QTJ16_001348 [Diplocarpon rosae]|uniref:Cytochrome P450 n=1 Tax=Diplocarpon rosae TaxID=946125 RepID=A0AAD9WHG0_9HELO|nr:hypothetical protein QTJ16_001348 [Diplocarpon rosae]PBP28990.1 prostacyclin synthase [Diplocarpon rosae]
MSAPNADPYPSYKVGYGHLCALSCGLVIAAIAICIPRFMDTVILDHRDPPIVQSKLPLIGHLLGIITQQADYYQTLSATYRKPIFTLKILSQRIHVVTSPSLVQSVFRHAKTLSFDPITTSASKRIFQMTDRQTRLLQGIASHEEGEEEYPVAKATYRVMHATLQPSVSLFQTTAVALQRFASSLDVIGTQGDEVQLYEWLQHHFTIATAEALYGPFNPISEDTGMIRSLVDFEKSIGLLFLDIFPALTCPAGHRARAAFVSAFRRYYNAHDLSSASAIIRGRHDVLTSSGLTTDDLASFDIGILMAATMNSNPGLFWLLSFIYSSPSLLSSIRAEVDAAIPETLRLRAASIPNRVVVADTALDDTVLLRKGAVVQLPCQTIHTSPTIWGLDASAFDPTRFLASTTTGQDREHRRLRKQAYNPFGGGAVLCPGRHFSSMEIVGVVAMLVKGFEIQGVQVLGVKMQSLSEQVKHPDGDLKVIIRRREGWQGLGWRFEVSDEGGSSMFK